MNKLIYLLLLFFSLFAQASGQITPFAEVLYWRASEESSSVWASIISLNKQLNVREFEATNAYFQWAPGVRAGLELNGFPSLDTRIYWTHFDTQANEHATAALGQIITPEFFNGFTSGDIFFAADLKWQLQMNMIDAELGHKFKPTTTLSLRPFIGLKGGSINQHINSNWTGLVATSTEQLKNNFYSIGPSLGLGGQWDIMNNLKLIGDFSTAFMWGHWDIEDHYHRPSALFALIPELNINSSTPNSTLGTMMYRFLLGLEWHNQLNQLPFKIRAGYEMQLWSNQLRLATFQQLPLRGDLTLQGATCGIFLNL